MNARDRQEITSAFLLVLVTVGAMAVLNQQCGCSPAPLRPEDTAHIAAHGLTLERCKAEGREAGSYAAYEACKKDGGL